MPEIIRQAEEYGLPTPESAPLPSAEKVADLLAPPTPWAGPLKREAAGIQAPGISSTSPPGMGKALGEDIPKPPTPADILFGREKKNTGGPMFPPGVSDTTAVPNADYNAQVDTATGGAGKGGVPPTPKGSTMDWGKGGQGGQFNPNVQLDTSTTSSSGPPPPPKPVGTSGMENLDQSGYAGTGVLGGEPTGEGVLGGGMGSWRYKNGEHLGVPPAPGRPPTPSADPATAMDEPRPAAGAGAGL